jgi:hypothetical protein
MTQTIYTVPTDNIEQQYLLRHGVPKTITIKRIWREEGSARILLRYETPYNEVVGVVGIAKTIIPCDPPFVNLAPLSALHHEDVAELIRILGPDSEVEMDRQVKLTPSQWDDLYTGSLNEPKIAS